MHFYIRHNSSVEIASTHQQDDIQLCRIVEENEKSHATNCFYVYLLNHL